MSREREVQKSVGWVQARCKVVEIRTGWFSGAMSRIHRYIKTRTKDAIG